MRDKNIVLILGKNFLMLIVILLFNVSVYNSATNESQLNDIYKMKAKKNFMKYIKNTSKKEKIDLDSKRSYDIYMKKIKKIIKDMKNESKNEKEKINLDSKRSDNIDIKKFIKNIQNKLKKKDEINLDSKRSNNIHLKNFMKNVQNKLQNEKDEKKKNDFRYVF